MNRPHRKSPIDTGPDSIIYHCLQARLNHRLTSAHAADTWQKKSWCESFRALHCNILGLLIIPGCLFSLSLTLICCMPSIRGSTSLSSLQSSSQELSELNLNDLNFVAEGMNFCPKCKLKQVPKARWLARWEVTSAFSCNRNVIQGREHLRAVICQYFCTQVTGHVLCFDNYNTVCIRTWLCRVMLCKREKKRLTSGFPYLSLPSLFLLLLSLSPSPPIFHRSRPLSSLWN